jgi:chaperonin GroES
MGGGGIQAEMPQGMPSTTEPPQEMQQYGDQEQNGYGDDQPNPLKNIVDYALSQANLAKRMDEEKLDEIGATLYQGYLDDEQSREDWMKTNREWMKLALLTRENKSWPWPKAANVKYPLIATAAMQFSARAYPALVPSDGTIVKARVTAVDQQGQLQQAAIRVGKHMSYQLTCDVDDWEEDMDKLLMTIAVSGLCFKKTYYDSLEKKIVSKLVYPENLCMNYWTRSIDQCYRKTEILHYTENEIKEKVKNNEQFLDIEYGFPSNSDIVDHKKPITTKDEPNKVDEATPHTFLAVHTYWDIDDDGYEEPYIITIHKSTRKVVRIVARWDSDGVYRDDKGKVIKICPVEYFTDFPFIPNPDGSIYALGFGMLLGPLNEASNTLINQLIDAGTMANLQAGFIGRNLRIKDGQLQLRPNEWKVVNATGEDLQKSIYPLPTKEPSNVLMSLLQMLITSGNQLASIAEIFVGKMPGQNTPATTTQETIQQGMAVFTAIYKRVYRSLQKEFRKIFRLNRITPNIVTSEQEIVGQIQQSDYEGTEHLIVPGADPSGDSQAAKMQKLQQVGQLLQLGTINPQVYTQRMLEALELPNYQEMIAQPQPPQPDPRMQTEQMKQQTMQQKANLDAQGKQQDMANKAQDAQLKRQEQLAKIDAQDKLLKLKIADRAMEANHKRQMAALDHAQTRRQAQLDLVTNATKAQQEVQLGQMKAAHEDAIAQRDMAREDELHTQKMELTRKAMNQKKGAKK